MQLSEKIYRFRSMHNLSQESLANMMNVSNKTVSAWEKGTRSPKLLSFASLGDLYNLNLKMFIDESNDYYGQEVPSNSFSSHKKYTQEEDTLIRRYRSLDNYGKEAVNAVLDVEERRVSQAEAQSDKAIETPEDAAPKTKMIPLYRPAAGAGGITDISEDYEVPADSKADFAIKVSGDSMEPYLMDGEIYFGHKGIPKDGDVVAVLINGEYFVKLFTYNKRAAYFISANPLREDTNRTVWLDGQDRVQRIGIIDTPEKVPMP